MLWCFAAIFAALFQSIKNALQKHLKAYIYSQDAINWVRYIFGIPFIVLWFLAVAPKGVYFLETNPDFFYFCSATALSQIIGSKFMIALFSYRSFAVGITYTRTQVLQAALFESLFFGVLISQKALLLIILGLFGVFIISFVDKKITVKSFVESIFSKIAFLGILCGAFFAFSSIMGRQAMLAISSSESDYLVIAFFTLSVIIAMESTFLGIWLFISNRSAFLEVLKNWKLSILVGLCGSLGSALYYIGFAKQSVAYVSAVGQTELLFSVLITHYFFKEKITKIESVGLIILVLSVVLLPFVA